MDFLKQFEEIRKDRKGVVESSVYPGLKVLVSEIYPEEAHFIYELLQNAEDALASEVEFEILPSKLVFRHNGKKQFDGDDVNSITNIAHSTKKENYVQAGKFGIGFKSVYAFTETPYIYCDTINFKIEKLLLPTEIEPLKNRKEGWTEFHFPFDSPKISAIDAKAQIQKGLLEIENTTLLFLNNIEKISYILENGKKQSVVKTVKENMIISAVIDENNNQRNSSIWKRFTKKTFLHEKPITVDIAFPMRYGARDKSFRILGGEDKVCITFWAKNEKSNLKFLINAPFGCTPARDSINKQDKDNQILIKALAELVVESLEILKTEELLTDDFFNILPLDEDEIPSFYEPIVEAIRNCFKNKYLLPTINGRYTTVQNGIMSSRNVIDRVLFLDDIRFLYRNEKLEFVKNRAVNTRAYKFLKSLKIEELNPDALLKKMIELPKEELIKWFAGKSNAQICILYGYLLKGVQTLKQTCEQYEYYEDYYEDYYRNNEHYKEEYENARIYREAKIAYDRIRNLPMIKSASGEFKTARELYVLEEKCNVPDEFMLVEGEVVSEDDAKEFVEFMGAKKFSNQELKKYRCEQEKNDLIKYLTQVKVEDDPLMVVNKILNYLDTHEEKEINFSPYHFVWAFDKKRKYVLSYIEECFLDAPYVKETGFRFACNVHGKKELGDVYTSLPEDKLRRWLEFLKRHGILYKFEVLCRNNETGFSTGYFYDYGIKNLQSYIDIRNIPLNLFIWKTLTSADGWEYTYGKSSYKRNRNYAVKREDSEVVRILKNNEWIPDLKGVLRKPCDISRSNIDKRFVVDENNGFLNAIGFEEHVKEEQEKRALEQEKEQEAAKLLGFENADAVLKAKERDELFKEAEALGIDLKEIIESRKNTRKEQGKQSINMQLENLRHNNMQKEEEDIEEDTSHVKKPERRGAKLREEIDKDTPEETKNALVKKSVINKEEKQWVGTQYKGLCQICRKTIIKKNGKRHFTAINLLNTEKLPESQKKGLATGWNTLCVCPNCAAEFKYGVVSLFDFKEKVLNMKFDENVDDAVKFKIEMQGEERELRYTPKHLFALKTALEYLQDNNDVGTVFEEDADTYATHKATHMYALSAGDLCPNCKTKNFVQTKCEVYDRRGNKKDINALKCRCGTIYFTKRMYDKLKDKMYYDIVTMK